MKIVGFHIVQESEQCADGQKSLKASIHPHCIDDDIKDEIREYSTSVPLAKVRMTIALGTYLKFQIYIADMKRTHLQSGPIQSELKGRPSKEWRWSQ